MNIYTQAETLKILASKAEIFVLENWLPAKNGKREGSTMQVAFLGSILLCFTPLQSTIEDGHPRKI